MRLLRRTTEGTFELTKHLMRDELPNYAILSHTWLLDDENEVTFNDVMKGHAATKRESYAKIQFCGEQAARDGLEYFWIDTCCINKKDSAELQEAITAMYSWYHNAARCYAYLSDVSVGQANGGSYVQSIGWEAAFCNSRWFTRGWTLQELLAPPTVEFFSSEGTSLGDKTSLGWMIHQATGIPIDALQGDALSNFSVEERLSWATKRQTKRPEDRAYCLLGLFNVFMPLLYGEEEHAFDRLLREIEQKDAGDAVLDQFMSTLPHAPEAAFNSLQNQHEPTCLMNTRKELLQHISSWVEGMHNKPIFWLNGIAGTGKSTIARTIARTFNQDKLGGSFFFAKRSGDLSRAHKVASTLARQIATRIPEARRHIREAIMKQVDITQHSFRDQWERLIIQPLSKLQKRSPPSVVLLVIDALDECDNENDTRVILRVITATRALSNIRLRVFITSRPEAPIRHLFNRMPANECEIFLLHEVDHALIDRDLNIFFESIFRAIREERDFDEEWPGNMVINRLVEASGGLFIWASTAHRFIYDGNRLAMTRRRIDKRINRLINGLSSGFGPGQQLDQIYTAVFRDFIQQDLSNEKEQEESYLMLRNVLGTIVLLYSPLSMESLARLLQMPTSDVKDTLADLHTILNISSDGRHPVRPHHPTFRDFLLNKERCIDDKVWVDEKAAHRALGDRCVLLMSKWLKPNICGLESPGALQKDLNPKHVARCIPPDLQYACLHWVEHYRQSGIQLSDGDEIARFFKDYFLYWLEAINLMGKSTEMVAIMRLYHSLLMPDYNVRQIPFVKDARRLMFTFQNIIEQAPLQVYCAALVFLQPSNEQKGQFRTRKHPWIDNVQIAEANVPKAKYIDYVNELSFTPDGRYIASGSNFEAARFWDVESKATMRKYEAGSTDKIGCIAISPDGQTLVAGSDDFTIMAWNIKTGELNYSIKAHTGWVNSVAFSPDGKLLVSSSMDQTVAFWDAATGKETKRLGSIQSRVNSAVFSPDGSLTATGSNDEIVRIWDISNAAEEIRVMFDGHSGPINSVQFSPNGELVASGSDDKSIKLWNLAKGTEFMTLKGHTKKIMAVSFSPDARIIASGSEDKTVRLWDATSGATLAELRDNTTGINSVTFSPNGKLLATIAFDDEVRLWQTSNWNYIGKLDDFEETVDFAATTSTQEHLEAQEPGRLVRITVDAFIGHQDTITQVSFSPNGQFLASLSRDGTMKLWLEVERRWKLDAVTSGICRFTFSPNSHMLMLVTTKAHLRLWRFQNKGYEVDSITTGALTGGVANAIFSPNSRMLASYSTDSAIRLWDAVSGTLLRTLQGPSGTVRGVCFSPCNRYLVSWSEYTTTYIWDLLASSPQFVPLHGHTAPITSISFSAHGQLFASCSRDTFCRLWDKNGTLQRTIESSSAPITYAAISPDDKLVACYSADKVITFYDVKFVSQLGSVAVGVELQTLAFSNCGGYLETDRGLLDITSSLVSYIPTALPSPTIQSCALFATEGWVRRNNQNAIWLPDEYRTTAVATYGHTIVLGHSTGSISFVRLA